MSKKDTEKTSSGDRMNISRMVSVVGRFMGGQRHLFTLAGLMLAFEAATAVLVPLLGAYVIDYLALRLSQLDGKAIQPPRSPLGLINLPPLFNPDVDTILLVTVGIVLLTMINSLADSLAEIYLAKGGRTLGYNLRVSLYAHLQKLSLAFHDQRRTGDVITRITSDVAALEEFIVASLSDFVGSVLLIVFILTAMIINAWQVAVLAAIIIPVMALISNYFTQRIKTAAKKRRTSEGELASAAQEMLTSIRVIQTYGQGSYEQSIFAEQSQRAMDSALEAAAYQARFSWVVSVLGAVSTAAIIWMAVWLIFRRPITAAGIGLLTAYIKYIQDMFKPTKRIIQEWNTFGKLYASVERIGDLMDLKPAVQDEPGAITAPRLQGNIEFRNVNFAYPAMVGADGEGKQRAGLKNINFSIQPGQVVAVVGHTGAGKSTIVQLIPRLYDPQSGEILIDGKNIRSYTLDSLRAQISMVLQESILFSGSVVENIAYGRPEATGAEIIAAAKQANAHEFIEKFPEGYYTMLGERGSNLSGGQRQRIAIARAFIRNTSILIMDEPTTGLDAESTDLVLRALRKLMQGKTTIIISHDLNLIRDADKIIVIKAGEIEQIGTHDELLRTGGLYANLYIKQYGQPAPAPVPESIPTEIESPAPSLLPHSQPMLVQSQAPTSNAEELPDQEKKPAVPEAPPGKRETLPASTTSKETLSQVATGSTVMPATPVAPTSSEIAKTGQPETPSPLEMPPEEIPVPQTGFIVRQPEDRMLKNISTSLDYDLPRSKPFLDRLPALEDAFDAEKMKRLLANALIRPAGTGFTTPGPSETSSSQILECIPGKAMYLSDHTVSMQYDLRVRDGETGEIIRSLVNARLFPDLYACKEYLRKELGPLAGLAGGRPELRPFTYPIAVIERLHMAVSVFPLDGMLPTLLDATDSHRMLPIFNETFPPALSGAFEIRHVRLDLAHYGRYQRCVLRYRLEGDIPVPPGQPPGTGFQQHIVYGKVDADGQGRLTVKIITALQEYLRGRDLPYPMRIPGSYGYLPDLKLLLMEALAGGPAVKNLFKDGGTAAKDGDLAANGSLNAEEAMVICARMLATLHRSGIHLGRVITFEVKITSLRGESQTMCEVYPDLGNQIQSCLDQVVAYAQALPALPLVLSHGDYTYTQLIFDGKEAGLVDFDTICQAEPAMDLGQFIAYQRLTILKDHPEQAETVDRLGQVFLDAYIAAMDNELDKQQLLDRVKAYELLSLIRLAMHSWQKLKGSRLKLALTLLEERLSWLTKIS